MYITLTEVEVKQAVSAFLKTHGFAVSVDAIQTKLVVDKYDDGSTFEGVRVNLDHPANRLIPPTANKPVPPAPDYPRAIDTKVTLEEHELLTKDRQWEGGRIVYPNKIEVIKQVRHRTGGGLKESKDLVDKYVMEIEN